LFLQVAAKTAVLQLGAPSLLLYLSVGDGDGGRWPLYGAEFQILGLLTTVHVILIFDLFFTSDN
jgi:hypothetical protein